MRNHFQAIVLLLLVLPAISCSRNPKYEFPLVQKYATQAGDVFYFRPRDGQFVLVERRKALAVAIAPEPDIHAFAFDDHITVSRPVAEPQAFGGRALEGRTFVEKITAQQALAISADGRMLAGGDANGVVSVWNISNASLEFQLNKTSGVLSLAFSPDGNFLAVGLAKSTGEPSDTVWLYDIRTRTAQRSFGRNAVLSLAWSSDSHSCAAGLDDGSVLLAEVTSDVAPQRIALSASPVAALDFHPSGLFLASAHADKRLLVCKLPAAELIYTFEPAVPASSSLPRGVERVAFDGTGSRFAADYAEGEMRIWDTSSLAKSLAK